MGSTRLPGKVLLDLCGAPMIVRQMQRMERAKTLDEIVVAIPDTPDNDRLAEVCLARGWALYRGPEFDVLQRYLGAAECAEAGTVVRITADCPLIDPAVIDDVVHFYQRGDFDFVSNNLIPTFPHGMDVEVMSRGTLAIAESKATQPYDREHVTPWITRVTAGGGIFRIGNYAHIPQLDQYRVTVDHPEDFVVARAVWERFLGFPEFTMQNVVDFLAIRPDLVRVNAKHHRPRLPAMGTA